MGRAVGAGSPRGSCLSGQPLGLGWAGQEILGGNVLTGAIARGWQDLPGCAQPLPAQGWGKPRPSSGAPPPSPHPCLLLQNFPEQQPPQQQWPRLGCPPWASPWCPAWGASWARTTSAGRGSAGTPACRSPRGTRPAGRWAPSGAPSTQPWGRWAGPSSPSRGPGAELLLHVLLGQQAFSRARTFSSRASREGRAGWLAPWLFSQLQG